MSMKSEIWILLLVFDIMMVKATDDCLSYCDVWGNYIAQHTCPAYCCGLINFKYCCTGAGLQLADQVDGYGCPSTPVGASTTSPFTEPASASSQTSAATSSQTMTSTTFSPEQASTNSLSPVTTADTPSTPSLSAGMTSTKSVSSSNLLLTLMSSTSPAATFLSTTLSATTGGKTSLHVASKSSPVSATLETSHKEPATLVSTLSSSLATTAKSTERSWTNADSVVVGATVSAAIFIALCVLTTFSVLFHLKKRQLTSKIVPVGCSTKVTPQGQP